MEPSEESRLLPVAQPLNSAPIPQSQNPAPLSIAEEPRGYPGVGLQSSHPSPSISSVKCSNTTIVLLALLGIILIGGSVALLILLT